MVEVDSNAEAVRLSLEQVLEMGRFWRFMEKSKGKLKPGSLSLRSQTKDQRLDEAGIEQFVDDLRKGQQWPKGTEPWLLPRRWDRPEDRVTIALGVRLYRKMPVSITPQVLVRAVTSTAGLLKRSPDEVRKDVERGIGVPPW